jgi:hypothetical protein
LLSREQAQFVFGWGVLLQLADDLQDVREDRDHGMLTVFSEIAGRQPLDDVTSRTLQVAELVMQRMETLPGPDYRALKDMIERSSRSVLIRSAGDVPEFYSKDYLARLEAQSPFRFSFVNERRRHLASLSGLLNRLFEAFLQGDEDEPAFPLLPSLLMP